MISHTSSEYKPDFTHDHDETSFYFKTCGERTFPHRNVHKQDIFLGKYNPVTNKIMYICLSSECNKDKMTEIREYNEGLFCEDDIAFADYLFNKKHCNSDVLIYSVVGRPYLSPKYIKFVKNYINRFFVLLHLLN